MASSSTAAKYTRFKEVEQLLSTPFGPYPDDLILDERCKSTKSSVLALEEFMLECEGRATGLDQTEPHPHGTTPLTVSDQRPLPNSADIRFRGILTIHTLAHLTEIGLKYLEEDFKERQTQASIKGDLRKQYASSKLKNLYDSKGKGKPDGFRIRVWVQGSKHLTAGYLTSKLVPNGLMIHTKDQGRNYEVISFDVETYMLSRTYLLRYHTLHTLDEIIKLDDGETPVASRTPEWVVTRYLADLAYPARSRWRRVYYNHDASSSEEASGIDDRPPADALDAPNEIHNAGRLTRRPRHLRRVHASEVRSVLASHVEWIIAEQEQRQKKWIDLPSWRAWMRKVELTRAKARKADPSSLWGIRDEYGRFIAPPQDQRDSGQEQDQESEIEVVQIVEPVRTASTEYRGSVIPLSDDESSVPVPVPPKKGKRKTGAPVATSSKPSARQSPGVLTPSLSKGKGKGKGRGRAKGKSPAVGSAYTISDEEDAGRAGPSAVGARRGSSALRGRGKGRARPSKPPSRLASYTPMLIDEEEHLGNIYDSDFSEESTPPASPSSSELSRPPTPGDPEIERLIPQAFYHPPDFPAGFRWVCPIGDCMYTINLMDLTDENVRNMKRDKVSYLRGQHWKVGDERLTRLFDEMVSAHYDVHMIELGLKFVKVGKKMNIEWIDPKMHRPWPPQGWVDMMAERRPPQSNVKQEDTA